MMPYSRMQTIPGYSYAAGKVRRLELHKKYFPELELLNPDFIQKLIGYMTERARSFATTKLQHEKVSALGKLSAGIAHELNNPAAAINRISAELNTRLKENFILTQKLLQHSISPDKIAGVEGLLEQKQKVGKAKLSAMQRMQREDEMNEWIERNELRSAKLAIETFTDAGLTGKDLDGIKNEIDKKAFADVLLWMENLLSSQKAIIDLDEASTRISNLVGAIKSHVHMDRTNELQPTDIHKDIDNTLTLLGYKLREKNITVKKIYCQDILMVPAYVGELNQVWTNIIDNAIFAMQKDGELSIETICNLKNVIVKLIDTGSGIPPEIISRIFDPFFTTKKQGEGTGIGLDLVNRIIKHHNGTVNVNSKPGRTEFTISIPLTH